MKILITGGAGFIGSHLSDALLAAGHEITIIDDLSSGTKDFLPKEAEFLKMDIRNEKLTDIFKERHFDIIYHEAAQTMVPASIDNPYLDADINISGMLRVLEAARKTDVQKIIFSSSAAVYGDNPALPLTENLIPAPSSFYGLTKWMTEKYLALYHKIYELSYTVLRYSNVYGPGKVLMAKAVSFIFLPNRSRKINRLPFSETVGRPGILFPSMMLFLPTWQLYIRRTAKL